ncbi:MAG: hypothetical protein V3W41_13575, partial [Planctomycetota bacterium]
MKTPIVIKVDAALKPLAEAFQSLLAAVKESQSKALLGGCGSFATTIVDGGLKVRINGALYTGRQASSVPMAEIPSDSRVRSLRAASK